MSGEGNIITEEKLREIQFPVNLRDYFAGQALKGIAYTQGKFTGWSKNVKENIEWDARLAYAYADAMIAERNKEE
jgi:hypothetical protein